MKRTDGINDLPVFGESADAAYVQEERQLGLVDMVLGLEAQVAELSVRLGHVPSTAGVVEDLVRTRNELDAVYRSMTWKVGTVVSFPLRAARKVFRRLAR